MSMKRLTLSIITGVILFLGCGEKPAADRAKQSLERWNALILTARYDLALQEAQKALSTLQEAHQRGLYDSTLYSNTLWAVGVSYWGIRQWDSACYAFNAALDADTTIPWRAPNILEFQTECCDPAHNRLSDNAYHAVTDAFDHATFEFQFLVNQRVMPYAEFLALPLDDKIKVCNKLGRDMNMQEYVWVMALQEWLPVDAKLATTIAAY
jgi:tetratricopeptide (TPR) repeat protein